MPAIQRTIIAAVLVFSLFIGAPAIAAQGETFEGLLEIMRADDFTTGVSTTTYYLRPTQTTGGKRWQLNFTDGPPDPRLRTGDAVTVQGSSAGDRIAVASLQPLASLQSTRSAEILSLLPAIMEDRRAVILIVDMLDAVNPLDVDDVTGFMYTDSRNVDELFKVSSWQQLGFTADTDGDSRPDVFGPFPIDFNAADGCDYGAWADAAETAATDAGLDLSQYQHKVFMLPSEASCGWSGLGSVGCSANYCRVWVREGGGPVLAHELGHNLGWHHASTDPENDGTINSEYGDRSGIMGYPYWSQAIAPHRDERHWFDAFPGSLREVDTSGDFDLYALELDPGSQSVGCQAIKIAKPDTNESYYLSYRRQIGDYPVHADYAERINIHRHSGSGGNTVHITNLAQGDRFTDSINGISVTATAIGGDRASVSVTLAGSSPNAAPSAAFHFSALQLGVQFIDASSDDDGTVIGWDWDFGDGTGSGLANPSHTYAAAGTYTVRLTVTDDDGATNATTDVVTVDAPAVNRQPVAAFDFAVDDLQIQFTDTSTDSDGIIAIRQWDFGDGNTSDQENPGHTYAIAGAYAVRLTVTDDEGASASVTRNVSTNLPPSAGFNVSIVDRQVDFRQTCSDFDGSVQRFTWDFGDGNASVAANPSHTYAVAGEYTVTLTIWDDAGASASWSRSVSITAAGESAPTVGSGSISSGGGGSGGGCFIEGLWP